jgi:hypothetical protein
MQHEFFKIIADFVFPETNTWFFTGLLNGLPTAMKALTEKAKQKHIQ